jgi:UDP-N-acetylmuramate--alanine ligase
LLNKMTNDNKRLVSKENLIPEILANNASVIVTIGAGDLGEMVPSIKKALYENV